MAETLMDRIIQNLQSGVPASEINSAFKAKYGKEVKDFLPDTPYSEIQRLAKPAPTFSHTRDQPQGQPSDEAIATMKPVRDFMKTATGAAPQASGGSRLGNWAEGAVAGVPALAAGAMQTVGDTAAGRFVGKAFDAVNDPFGLGPKTKESPPSTAVDEAEAANRAVRQGRKETSLPVLNDLGDLVGGAGRIIAQVTNMEGPPNESPADTAKRRYEQGGQLAAGAIGGTKDITKGLADFDASNPLRTQPASLAATLLPAARAARAGLAATGEAAAARGGALGSIGRTIVKGTDLVDYPQQALSGVGETVLKKLGGYPGGAELAAKLDAAVQAGKLTVAEAAEYLDKHTPLQAIAAMHDLSPKVADAAALGARVAKGAAWGALLGEPSIGAIGGAAVGAGLPLVGAALRKVNPTVVNRAAAAYRRQTSDPVAQETAGATEVVRNIAEPPQNAAAEVRDLATQAASEYRASRVVFDTTAPKAPTPGTIAKVSKITATGEMLPPIAEVERRAELGKQATSTARWVDLAQDVVDNIAELKNRPDQTSPQWQAATANYKRLKKEYEFIKATADDHAPATIRRALGDVFPPMAQSLDRSKMFNAETALRDQIAQGKQDLRSLKGGNAPTAQPTNPVAYGQETNALAQSEAEHLLGRREAEAVTAKPTVAVKPAQPDWLRPEALKLKVPQRALFDAFRDDINFAYEGLTSGVSQSEIIKLIKQGLKSNKVSQAVADQWVRDVGREVSARNFELPPAGSTQLDAARQRVLDLRKQSQALKARQPLPVNEPTPLTTNWTAGLNEASGLQVTGGNTVQRVVTTNPIVEHAIDRATETMTAQGQTVPRHWFARAFTDVLHDKGLSLLFSPRMRARVATELAGANSALPWGKGVEGRAGALSRDAVTMLRRQLDDAFVALNAETLGPKPQSMIIELPNGKRHELSEILADVVANSPKMMDEIRADAMDHVGKQLAIQAEDSSLSKSMQNEINRFIVPATDKAGSINPRGVKDAAGYAANVVQRVLAGEAMPQLPPFNPVDAGKFLRTLVAENKLPAGADAARVLDLAKEFETRYVPAPEALKNYINHQRALGEMPASPGDSVWVAKGAAATLNSRVGLLEAAKQVTMLDKWAAQSKLAMTAYRLKTQINNIGSNLIHQFIRRGETPIGVMHDAITDAVALHNHLNGKASPEGQMWQAISRSGLGNLAQLDGEVGALRAMSSPHGVPQAALHHASNIGKKVYALGDMPFKVNEAARAFRQDMGDMLAEPVGSKGRLSVGGGRAIEMTRIDGGFEAMGRTFMDGSDALADLVAKGAVDSAQRNFINPTHAPLWVQQLRAKGALGGIAAQFMSWGWATTELPGKKGLLRNMLDFDGNYNWQSNNPATLARNAARALEVATRRAALTGAVRNGLDQNRDVTREMLERIGGSLSMDVQPGSDQWHVRVHDSSNQDPYIRAQLVLRVGNAGLASLVGPNHAPSMAELAKQSPEAAKRVRLWTETQAKQVATWKDVLNLFLLSGNQLLDLAKGLNDASDPRSKTDASTVLARFAASVIGGTPMDTIKVGVAANDPTNKYSGFTGQKTSISDPTKAGVGDFWDFALDSLVGNAYKEVQLLGAEGKAKHLIDNANAALQHSLSDHSKKRLDELFAQKMRGQNAGLVDDEIATEMKSYVTASMYVQQWIAKMQLRLTLGAMKAMKGAPPESRKAESERLNAPPDQVPNAQPIDREQEPVRQILNTTGSALQPTQ